MATEEPKASKSGQPLFSLRMLLLVLFLAVLVCLFALWWSGYGLDNGKGLVATLITIATCLILGEFVRQRCRYSLRQLLIAITLIAIFLGFFSQSLLQARKQRQVVATINQLGGVVLYKIDDHGDGWSQTESVVLLPSWLPSVLGEDVFANVGHVDLDGRSVRDADLQPFGDVFKDLEHLTLNNTQITDAGLEHLKGLSNLFFLRLNSTQITDVGLVHIEGLTKLRWLDLGNTKVSAGGVKKLQQALPNCQIIR